MFAENVYVCDILVSVLNCTAPASYVRMYMYTNVRTYVGEHAYIRGCASFLGTTVISGAYLDILGSTVVFWGVHLF